MFRTVPLSIISSFSLYTQQWCMSYRFADSLRAGSRRPGPARKLSANLYDIYHCCVYSEKLLMMDRVTVRNMQNFIPKLNLSNKCIQLVYYNNFVYFFFLDIRQNIIKQSVFGQTNHKHLLALHDLLNCVSFNIF